jgi:hypothetical protein
MGNLELTSTVKMLQGQRAQVQKDLAKLDKAIAVLRELSGTNSTPAKNGKRRTLSAVARRRIAKSQKDVTSGIAPQIETHWKWRRCEVRAVNV